MIRRFFEDSVLTVKRICSRPVGRQVMSSALVAHEPMVKPCSVGHAWFICSRFHHICNNAALYGIDGKLPQERLSGILADVCLKSAHQFSLPHRILSPVYLTVRHNSISQEHNSQSEELDVLYKRIELRCKGHDNAVLDSYETFVAIAANELKIHIESVTKPKRKIKKLTLLKSRHIFKKHRVQYEMRTHFRVITLKHLTGSTADVFLEYIERNLPEGVAMQVKKCHLETMPSNLTPNDETVDALESSSSSSESSDSESSDTDEGKESSPT